MTDLFKGIVGFSASAIGVITSFQAQIDWVLRTVGSVVTIFVGVVTIWSIVKKHRSK